VTLDEEAEPIPLLTGSTGIHLKFCGRPDLHALAPPVLVPTGDRWLFETRAMFEIDLSRCRLLVSQTLFFDAFK